MPASPSAPEPPPAASRKHAVLGFLGGWLIRILSRLVRFRHHGEGPMRAREKAGERSLIAFWHRHLLLMPNCYRGEKVTVLISRHRDGEIVARATDWLPRISVSRGSSTRGGAAAVRQLLRRVREGYDLAITPDGPRGPVRVAKPGAVQVAALAGIPVIPVALAASRRKLFRSWDRFVLPLPGATVHFVYGEPWWVERGRDPDEPAWELTRRLCELEARAEELAGHPEAAAEITSAPRPNPCARAEEPRDEGRTDAEREGTHA